MNLNELALQIYGADVLRRRAEEITEFTPDLADLSERMFEVMYEEEGVGLAGPQVGVGRRIAVLDVPMEEGSGFRGTIINPVILAHDGVQKGTEGCLSIPGLREEVARHQWVQVQALNLKGEPFEFECEDLLARAVQHEIDHLDGILFVDRLSPVRRRLLTKRLKKIAAGEEAST